MCRPWGGARGGAGAPARHFRPCSLQSELRQNSIPGWLHTAWPLAGSLTRYGIPHHQIFSVLQSNSGDGWGKHYPERFWPLQHLTHVLRLRSSFRINVSALLFYVSIFLESHHKFSIHSISFIFIHVRGMPTFLAVLLRNFSLCFALLALLDISLTEAMGKRARASLDDSSNSSDSSEKKRSCQAEGYDIEQYCSLHRQVDKSIAANKAAKHTKTKSSVSQKKRTCGICSHTFSDTAPIYILLAMLFQFEVERSIHVDSSIQIVALSKLLF